MEQLTKLFEPIKVGTMELKNRIVMTGFAINNAEDTAMIGVMHQKYIDFFEERAKWGTSLIILPDTPVDRSLRFQSHPSIGGDDFNPGLSALTETVHMWGAKIAPDLLDFGYRFEPDWQIFAPGGRSYRPLSSSPLSFRGPAAKEMNSEEITAVQDLFVKAAVRAKLTGFDAVHLAGHFGFLIAQFLSPRFNKRTDHYGGSLDNRMRFATEIIEKIKAQIGNSIPIIFRLSADEFEEEGLTIKDSTVIAKRLQDIGVDMLNIVAGLDRPGKHHQSIVPMGYPQGPFIELGARIKDAVDIPIIIVGRITDPVFAEQILREGKADLIGMTRQLAADPEMPVKVAEKRFSDIVPCIGCNVCLQRLIDRIISRCSVNAAMGREKEFEIVAATNSKKVMIVGGGPAGMEAARVAALRQHKVSLYEKEDTLGGQFILSMKPPHKDEISTFRDYLVKQIEKLDVDIKLGIEVTPEMVDDIAPDVVILATGALPFVPTIPGIDRPNVVTAWDVLAGTEVGKNVVIAGGGLVGCETAEFLQQHGKNITIIEMLPEIALDVEKTNRSALLERFSDYSFDIMVNSKVQEITDEGVAVAQLDEMKTIQADTVIIAMGAIRNDSLAKMLRNSARQLHIVGDCASPARIVDAINHASYIARQL